jgi:hypothetical protein
MLNLDGAVQNPGTDRGKLEKALKNLKDSTEKAAKDLAIIKKIAEEKKLEAVWELTGQALDVTTGAHEGSEQGLTQYAAPKGKPKH